MDLYRRILSAEDCAGSSSALPDDILIACRCQGPHAVVSCHCIIYPTCQPHWAFRNHCSSLLPSGYLGVRRNRWVWRPEDRSLAGCHSTMADAAGNGRRPPPLRPAVREVCLTMACVARHCYRCEGGVANRCQHVTARGVSAGSRAGGASRRPTRCSPGKSHSPLRAGAAAGRPGRCGGGRSWRTWRSHGRGRGPRGAQLCEISR